MNKREFIFLNLRVIIEELTGLRVLCCLKVSSRIADWFLESLSFFLAVSASSSSLIFPPEHALSTSSLSLRFPLTLETVLFGDETPVSSSSQSITVDGNRFTSIPRVNVSEFRSVRTKIKTLNN